MITMHPDPKEIITFCHHLACMCSKYESLHKSPQELITDFFRDVVPEDCQFDINDVTDTKKISNYGDALSIILNLYFEGIPHVERFH